MSQRGNRNHKNTLPKPNNGPKDKVFLSNSNLPCKVLPKSNNPIITKFLNCTVSVFGDNSKEQMKIKDLFVENDFWFSDDLKKIVISSSGLKKLIAISKASFHKIIPLEKQCDGPSKEREQVWLEATAIFPDGSTSVEYGIASKLNVEDEYDKTILPIIAKKRAIARCLLNASCIDLGDCVASIELPTGDKTYKSNNETSLKESYLELETLYKKLINELCRDLTTKDGINIWKLNDPQLLLNLSSNDSYLISYIAKLRIEHLVAKDKNLNN